MFFVVYWDVFGLTLVITNEEKLHSPISAGVTSFIRGETNCDPKSDPNEPEYPTT